MDKSGPGQAQKQATLVRSLMRVDAFPHPVSKLRLFETHISWVILTGQFAYKIKKALRLAFLDFSTLEYRRHFCDEELRLNRRWAPELYLDVVPIFGSHDCPTLTGDGSTIEYAVKMLQFEQSLQLDKQLELELLSEQDMCDLAETIAQYHEESPVNPFHSANDTIEALSAPMYDNFPPLEPHVDASLLARVRDWTERSLGDSTSELVERHRQGFVRECHGDLHLTNLVRLPSGIVPYDCVEFSPQLRIMDILSDISFLVMDLVARERVDLAYVLLNRYLEKNGDYRGMSLLGLYFVYHCMIRAKVAAIRNTERSLCELANRLAVANDWIDRSAPTLVVMHGYSGSGKTWLSSRLLSSLPAIRVRSDIERKRLHALGESDDSGSAVGGGIYTASASEAVYVEMLNRASQLLEAGFNVILDAAFLDRNNREGAREVANAFAAPFVILDVRASNDVLERRLRARTTGDVSEANVDVLRHQLDHAEALDEVERRRTLSVDTGGRQDIPELTQLIKSL